VGKDSPARAASFDCDQPSLFGGVKILTWVFAFIVVTRLVLAWQAGHANIVIVTDLLFAVAVGFGFGNGAVFKLVAQYFPKNTGLVSGVVGCAGGLGGFSRRW
jgi:NNP family nitrate/nitrite transporter-like MFS transporter